MVHLFQMSDSFAECQEYIQKQQQEIMRLKLQHTLELKVCFVLRIPFSCATSDYYPYYYSVQQHNTALYILSRRGRTYDPRVPELVNRDKTYKLQTISTDRPSTALPFHPKCPFMLTLPASWRYKPLQLQILNLPTIRIAWSVFFPFCLFLCVQLNISSQKCSPVLELQSLVEELRSVIDLEHSPDTSSRRFEKTHRSRK